MASRTQRLLLAVLLVEANRVVSADRLADELWADDIPSDPAGALRTQISRLRKVLPPTASLVTEEGGYRLLVAPEELDASGSVGCWRKRVATIASGRCHSWTRRWRCGGAGCSRISPTGRSPSLRCNGSKSCTGRRANIVPPCC